MKRLLSITEETKKFKSESEIDNYDFHSYRRSVTCIENLSNELFYEIFDYLDSCDVFNAFVNLNTRFQQFLNNPSFLFKIYRFSTTEKTFKRYCRQVIIPNKHKIISLYLYDQVLINVFCTLCTVDQSYSRLESIVLNGIKWYQLLPLLINFMKLPRLVSLNIRLIGYYEDLQDVYEWIFKLPFLKYIKLTTVIDKTTALLNIATSEQISTIQYLNINNECTLDELFLLLSYTPYLRRLTCERLSQSKTTFLCILSNLMHMSINKCDLNFDEFEILIKQVCSKLQVLRAVNRSDDVAYIDANRWERLISQYIPHLRKFDFEFHDKFRFYDEFTSYRTQINRFTSSFWTKRQWIFELEIVSLTVAYVTMKYSIHSNRKKWLDFHQTKKITDTNQEDDIHQLISLIMTSDSLNETRDLLNIDIINPILSYLRITHLDVDCRRVSIITVIELIRCLPDITSLIIIPMTVYQIHGLTDNQIENFILDSRNSKLRKMKLRLITNIEQALFFIRLDQYIEYLEIECSNDIDVEILVQCILVKTDIYMTSQLCSMCLCVGQINDEIIEKLHRIMALKDWVYNYTVKRICDRIYLQWE